jgi:hypothetical protein
MVITKMPESELLIDWDSKQFGVWLRNFKFVYGRLYRYGYLHISGANVYRSKHTGHYHIILYYSGVAVPLVRSYYQALFMSDVKKELYYYIEGSNCLFEVKRKRGAKSVYEFDVSMSRRLTRHITKINQFKQYQLKIYEI